MTDRPELRIDGELAEAGVDLALGVLTARVDPARDAPALDELRDRAAADAAARLGNAPPAEQPAIAAARRAYKALGKDPARYRPAAEALLRRARQGKGVGRINPVVDVNNVVSLETGLSIGTHDLDALVPPLVCRAGRAGERYRGIGRGEVNLAGLPLLADGHGPCGCPTSDSVRAAVGPRTRRVLMLLYGFGGPDGLDAALDRAAELLQEHAGAAGLDRTVLRQT